jgi:hypothetical protein
MDMITELYFYRNSQAENLEVAMHDGAVRFAGKYTCRTKLGQAKGLINITADCLDGDEVIVFVEVTVPEY